MLSVRIIPCLDVAEGRVVKGVKFQDLRDAGDPVESAKAYEKQGADELVFLDIKASADNRDIMHDVVERTASECFMPLTVGGGLRNLEDIRLMLNAGADKVSLNTSAVLDPEIIEKLPLILETSVLSLRLMPAALQTLKVGKSIHMEDVGPLA